MATVRVPLLLLVVLLLHGCRGHRPALTPKAVDPWARVAVLEDQARLLEALAVTDSLLAAAARHRDAPLQLVAHLHRARLRERMGLGRMAALRELDLLTDSLAAAGVPPPIVPLLHSALAGAWWEVYAADRRQVLERAPNATDTADVGTWDHGRFMRHILWHARRSVEPIDSLKVLPATPFKPLLPPCVTCPGTADTLSGPDATLLDLLGRRALDLLHHPEPRLALPADPYALDDPRHFALFEAFAYRPFAHADTTSWNLQTMRLHQRMERAHLSDDRPDALVDLVLDRLDRVRAASTLSHADHLQLDALALLRTRMPNDTCWSLVTLAMARWHVRRAAACDTAAVSCGVDDRRAALVLCAEAMDRFPASCGGRAAAAQHAALRSAWFAWPVVPAVLPGIPFRLPLQHRNSGRAGLRAVKDPQVPGAGGKPDATHLAWLVRQRPLHQWAVDLPGAGDLATHRTGLEVAALPPGRHALIVGDTAPNAPQPVWIRIQVTRLALRVGVDGALQVVDRANGLPLAGVSVRLFRSGAGAPPVRVAEALTNARGEPVPALPVPEGSHTYLLEQGEDRWMVDVPPPVSLSTFLFAEQRPTATGHELLVRGIVLGPEGVAGHHAQRVRLRDAHGAERMGMSVVTDAAGTFTVRMPLPLDVPTVGAGLSVERGPAVVRVVR